MSHKAASEKGSVSTTDDFNTPEDKALVRKIDFRFKKALFVMLRKKSNLWTHTD